MAIFKLRNPFYEQFRDLLEMNRVQDEVNRLYENFFGRRPISQKGNVFPAVNVSEDSHNVYVIAELPGVEADDIDITAEEESLILKGSRRIPNEGEEVSYHRREREEGRFNRKVSLPIRIVPKKVVALTKNGLLKIIMPKADEVKSKKIDIKVQ